MSDNLPGSNLPPWVRILIIIAVAAVFVANVVADWIVDSYDGQFESVILAGLLGTMYGVDKLNRRGGD